MISCWWDKVDDRLYVAPTEEEQKKVDRRNEILARKQEIKKYGKKSRRLK